MEWPEVIGPLGHKVFHGWVPRLQYSRCSALGQGRNEENVVENGWFYSPTLSESLGADGGPLIGRHTTLYVR
jgi:hypothetical protein